MHNRLFKQDVALVVEGEGKGFAGAFALDLIVLRAYGADLVSPLAGTDLLFASAIIVFLRLTAFLIRKPGRQ